MFLVLGFSQDHYQLGDLLVSEIIRLKQKPKQHEAETVDRVGETKNPGPWLREASISSEGELDWVLERELMCCACRKPEMMKTGPSREAARVSDMDCAGWVGGFLLEGMAHEV